MYFSYMIRHISNGPRPPSFLKKALSAKMCFHLRDCSILLLYVLVAKEPGFKRIIKIIFAPV